MSNLIAVLAVLVALAPGARADQAHGIAMHGALKYSSDFPHFDYVDPKAPRGGELRRAALGTFDSFNEFIIKGNTADGLAQIYDTLLTPSADEPFSQYGLLVESVDLPEDRSQVSFTLRPEARWHDGRKVTPEDVIWTFNTLMEKGTPFFRFYWANVDKVEKVGERTVRFSFKPGENRELPLILGQLPVLPKHYWEGRDFAKTTLEPPLGSGPYRVGKFEAGRFVSYERVENYWGKDLPVNAGRFNFDVLRFDYYRDLTVALEAFKGGALDYRRETSSKDWATAYDIPQVKDGWLVKETVPHTRPAGMQGYVFNSRRKIFADPRVRQALAYAFDFEWSNASLFYGQYTRTRSYFDNSELAARGLPEGAELAVLEPFRGRIPDEVFTQEYQPPKTDGSGKIRSNLKLAVELLESAGWKIQDGQMVHAESGEQLRFEILLVQPGFERISLPFAKNLERIGVKAKVRTVDTSQYQRRVYSHDFDMAVLSWGQSRSPGNEQRGFWGSAAASEEGSRNFVGIQDPAIDELIELVIASVDREALVTSVRALDRVLQWGYYVVPQWHAQGDNIVYWNKFGRPDVTPEDGVQVDTWWVDAEKAAALKQRGRSK